MIEPFGKIKALSFTMLVENVISLKSFDDYFKHNLRGIIFNPVSSLIMKRTPLLCAVKWNQDKTIYLK
jgi:hypothetical protein